MERQQREREEQERNKNPYHNPKSPDHQDKRQVSNQGLSLPEKTFIGICIISVSLLVIILFFCPSKKNQKT